MPAIMDDPDSPTLYRVSGDAPFPDPAHPSLPGTISPRQVTLRDRQTVATIVPFASKDRVPPSLLLYLSDQFKKEVEGGDTYPMIDPLPFEKFTSYWFQNFAAIMLLGSIESPDDVVEGKDWSKECLGSFYIKPNYPGRSSHVCNAGFLVTDASRNRGVGRLMGESYLEWAPKLGYTYSVFNLVYETNVASCKIWDALGFKRIGRVKGCGNLKSHPGRLIDAIIYGRDLALGESEELVSEERFDKIRFYLKSGKYPSGADRAEKSRLRSAATHYKLLDDDVLMLKDKEVIADPGRQYQIAREVHMTQHGGINKTTATIAERYHWSRIKETVSDVIRNCAECKEAGKTPLPGHSAVKSRSGPAASAALPSPATATPSSLSPTPSTAAARAVGAAAAGRLSLRPSPPDPPAPLRSFAGAGGPYVDGEPMTVMSPGQTLHTPTDSPIAAHAALPGHNPMLQDQPHGLHHAAPHHHLLHHHGHPTSAPALPLAAHHHHHHDAHSVYQQHQPIDPQIISQPAASHVHHHHHHHHHLPGLAPAAHPHDPFPPFAHHADAATFQALLHASDDDVAAATAAAHRVNGDADEADREAIDRDLDMLIEPQDEDDDEPAPEGGASEAAGRMDTDLDGDPGLGKMDIGNLLSADGAGPPGADRRGGGVG